jgi:hypothetical protein
MEILDAIIAGVVVAVIGYILNLFLHENLKSQVYFKFLKSPLKLSSSFIDKFAYHKDGFMESNEFKDTISIANESDIPIRIKRMQVIIEILSEAVPPSSFTAFWSETDKQLTRLMKPSRPVVKSGLVEPLSADLLPETLGIELPALNKPAAKITPVELSDVNLFPVTVKPKGGPVERCFGISWSPKLDIVRAKIIVYPVSDYKKPEISYNVVFSKGKFRLNFP